VHGVVRGGQLLAEGEGGHGVEDQVVGHDAHHVSVRFGPDRGTQQRFSGQRERPPGELAESAPHVRAGQLRQFEVAHRPCRPDQAGLLDPKPGAQCPVLARHVP
jgi:hypothetical protein